MESEEEVVVPETTEEEKVETPEETPQEEEVEEKETEVDWKAKAEEAERMAANQKIRAEKAEKKAKEAKEAIHKAEIPVKYEGLSPADLLAVMKANIHEDDMDRVERFARSEGLTIKEALKNEEMKAILDLRTEQRNTAGAANVSNVRRGVAKVSEDTLLAQASAGKLPETDYDIQRLIAAKAKRG